MNPRQPLCVHLLPDTHDAGAENQARYLIAGLKALGGLDLEIAYFGAGRAHAAFEELGVPMLRVPRRGRFRRDAFGRARRLRRAYRGRPPQILHTWMLEGNVIGLLAARAWHDTRVVITQRGSWNEMDYPALVRLERIQLGRADAAISNSDGGRDMLTSIGMEQARISVIPNGIPAERVATSRTRAEIRESLSWGARDVVVWVGRISDPDTAAQKDLPTLLSAVRRLRRSGRDLLLALVGPTEADIANAGLTLESPDQALAWQPRPADLIAAADAVALSSRREGNSNVVGEALLLGVPVVTTDCGEHVEVVRRAGGYVVPVEDAAALASGLAAILDDPPEREQVAHAVAADLSVERMVRATGDVYRKLLS